jgi:hypothetical protein
LSNACDELELSVVFNQAEGKEHPLAEENYPRARLTARDLPGPGRKAAKRIGETKF